MLRTKKYTPEYQMQRRRRVSVFARKTHSSGFGLGQDVGAGVGPAHASAGKVFTSKLQTSLTHEDDTTVKCALRGMRRKRVIRSAEVHRWQRAH